MKSKLKQIQAKGLDTALWQKLYNKPQQSYKRKRLAAIRLAQAASTTISLQNTAGCGHTTLNKWMDTYLQEGLPGLVAGIPHQKPQPLTADQRSKLAVMITNQQPCDVGLDAYIWTAALIKDLIKQEFALDYQTSGTYTLFIADGIFSSESPPGLCQCLQTRADCFYRHLKTTYSPYKISSGSCSMMSFLSVNKTALPIAGQNPTADLS